MGARVKRIRVRALPKLKPASVEVGFPAGTDSDVLTKAVVNHFGSDANGIPERPFLANAMRDKADDYREAMKAEAKRILDGERTPRQAMSRLGIAAQGDVQVEITDLRDPPNAQATINRKGSSNPLIDSGEMRAAVTYRVQDGAP